MIYDVSKLNASKIVIGRRGENLANTIEIDVSAWLAEWPSASLNVVVMRPGDTAPYVASTSVSNGVLLWPVSNVDTENAGRGKIEVRASSGDVMKKSVTATIEVEPCIMCDEDAEPPELDPALVEQAIAAAGRAESAVQEAKNIIGDGFSWDEVLGKPSVYPPESHGHNQSDIHGLSDAISQRTRVVNLLDNSWFLNPVNQRGKTSQLGQGYFIDRWASWSDDNQISLSTNGLTANQALTQGVPCDITKTYTAAVCLADGSIYAGTGIPANGDFGVWEKVWVVKTEYGVAFYLHVTNAPQTYRWAALYEGAYTADTLPAYVYKGYAAELAECQRYYLHVGGDSNSWLKATKILGWGTVVEFPVNMRIIPSVLTNGAIKGFDSTGNWAEISVVTATKRAGSVQVIMTDLENMPMGSGHIVLGITGLSADL